MNWMMLTKKQQQAVVATGVLVVVQILLMAWFLGWTKPADPRGGAAKAEVIKLQEKIDEARIVLSGDPAVREKLSEAVEKLENLTGFVPSESDRYAWAYEYISRRAADSGVTLDNVEELLFIGSGDGNGSAGTYEIAVSARCGYSRLVEFLSRLEKDNPLLRVKEVSVAAVAGQPLAHQVRFIVQWPASLPVERGQSENEKTSGFTFSHEFYF